ncbi:MAG TPA: dihydrodipicolinate synthase family protein, partial [Marisediminicola sp.]|nr:dihydrodipicolinate synthase family protein [Marisediminicola sp.]
MTSTPNPFGQVLVALVTPFTSDGEVDWPGVEKHIDACVVAGADGIVVTGTTG